tara:strand:- start:66 stop:413 length:348 start_codon:yes stop_codon:yes gene_type:complete
MKAILIDTKNAEVREVEHDDTLKNIYELVGCSTFDVVRIDETNSIYVDDEGLLIKDPLFFIYHGTNHDGFHGKIQALAGNGLILGVDSEGNSIAPTITVEEVKEAIDFREGTAWH